MSTLIPDDGGTATADPETETKTRHAPRYKVFVHNDDATPMPFVLHVLSRFFCLGRPQAKEVMMEAHESGVAFVGAYSFEQAEFRVEQAHALARTNKFPLKFTYEPE